MRVRVSIANLAWNAVNLRTGERETFGILNPKKPNQIMALGGGAMLNEQGKRGLEDIFGASDFEQDEKTGYFDARFRVEEEEVERIFRLFRSPSGQLERDPTLDIRMELTGREFPGYPHLLTPKEADRIFINYYRTVRQGLAKVGEDTSAKAIDVPTHRLFRIFDLVMPPELFDTYLKHPQVRLLDVDELASTRGGRAAGKSNEGLVIQNNLFLMDHDLVI
jgi:hypothetical protein